MKSKAFTIALVITAVILLILVGPRIYGWIFPPKIQLKETTITIADINDIAKLYISQYYGEVINSWTEEKCKDEVEKILQLYTQIRKDLNDPATREKITDNDSKLLTHVDDTFLIDKASKKRMDAMLEIFINAPLSEKKLSRKALPLMAKGKQRNTRIALYKYIRHNEKDIYEENYYEELIFEVRERWGIDEQIAYLARGKVLLSIDLSQLIAGDVTIDSSGTLTIKTPLIIDALINPNFIYGKSWSGKSVDFPGYVVIKNTKKAARKATLENVKQVKSGCKKKLILNALAKSKHDKDKTCPLNKALAKAEDKLFRFFSLFNTLTHGDKGSEKVMDLANIEKVTLEITEYKSESPEIQWWFQHQVSLMSYLCN